MEVHLNTSSRCVCHHSRNLCPVQMELEERVSTWGEEEKEGEWESGKEEEEGEGEEWEGR